ncbi:MAG: hypothetical protein EP330_30450 [Deltaproteobacteria bacterium]|nr:MAG: hypothetical protein EP330_30450 [Deltaproteobacteria bacterium]
MVGLTAAVVAAALVPQPLVGPTLIGAALSVLVAVYGFGWLGPVLSRGESKQLALRTAVLVGSVAGLAYGGVGLGGVVELPHTGSTLFVAAALVGVVSTGFALVLVLCGLDAAVSGRGGYAADDGAG